MHASIKIRQAANILLAGGVIAYPTEGVYGLGCLPADRDAVDHLLNVKGRSSATGLIIIAASDNLLAEWIAPTPVELERLQQTTTQPVTWIVTAAQHTPGWLTGSRNTVAVRITTHPIAAALSRATNSALVSTSANRAGRPAATSALQVRRWLGSELDRVVSGPLGGAVGPSEIRMALDNQVIRAASST
jgi:L-threonylcarbamoyladenylate synthase